MTIVVEGGDHTPAGHKASQPAASEYRSEIATPSAGTAAPMAAAPERASREQAARREEDAQRLKTRETKALSSTETTPPSPQAPAASSASAQPLAPLAIEMPAPPRTQDGTTAPSNGARREPISREPAVHIGSIEIIVEAPAEPRAAQQAAPTRASDFASRHYLRGL